MSWISSNDFANEIVLEKEQLEKEIQELQSTSPKWEWIDNDDLEDFASL